MMRFYQIKVDDEILPINTDKHYNLKSVLSSSERLNLCKEKLEDIFKNEEKHKLWEKCDPFKKEKKIIKMITNEDHITNAWLKIYEIVDFFKLIPETSDEYWHFDNAAFPGAFILAVRNYVYTKTKLKNFNWTASSLVTKYDVNKKGVTIDPLVDSYELYKHNKANWLMNDEFNGDVCKPENQEYIKNRLGGKIDLYTSDLGFSVDGRFENQERDHFVPNVGQILFGLNCLKDGGSFVTKQFTLHETVTISVIYAVSCMFDEFYICKPYTSRAANSEIYLVGKGFSTKKFKTYNSYYEGMLSYLSNSVNSNGDISGSGMSDVIHVDSQNNRPFKYVPLFDAKYYKSNYITNIVKIVKELDDSQITAIEEHLKLIGEGKFSKNTKPVLDWYMKYRPMPVFKEEKLTSI